MRPMKYCVFKGIKGKFGALNLSLNLPIVNSATNVYDKEGCLFLEITSATGPNTYDWENKIIFALGLSDIAQFLLALKSGNELKLMHDPGAKSNKAGQVTKNLFFSSPKGTLEGGILTLTESKNKETKTHTVPLNGAELIVLNILLTHALPKLLGW